MNEELKILNHMIDFYKKFCDGEEKLNPIATGKEIKAIEKLLSYTENLQSNWNSLREWLKTERDYYFENYYYSDFNAYGSKLNDVLDKMDELEGKFEK